MRKFLLWFFGLFVALAFLAIGAYFAAKKFEEPVRNYIVGEFNKRLQSPVQVGDINFSLWRRFPDASLVMDSVWAYENIVKMGEPDTLFFLTKVYLNLNLLDMIRGEYKINEIEGHQGFFHLYVDDQGYDNYHIWKPTKDTTGFLLELDRLYADDVHFEYKNVARQQHYAIEVADFYCKGQFSNDSYTMAVYGDGLVDDISIKGTQYLSNRQMHVECDLDIQTASDSYTFRRGIVAIDKDLGFTISGSFVGDGIDLHIAGKELDVLRTLALVPTETRATFDDYESTGVVAFDCTLKGAFGKTDNPAISISFDMRNAAIRRKDAPWELKELTGSGSLTNGDSRNFSTTKITIDQLSGNLNGDPFTTNFIVFNFNQPIIQANLKLTSDLEGINEFFKIESIDQASGILEVEAQIVTQLQDINAVQAKDFLNAKASGKILIKDGFVRLKDDNRNYIINDADFTIVNNGLIINNYSGAINECTVDLNGRADGFLSYFFSEDGVLEVKGDVALGSVNLDELFPATSESQSGIVVAFPEKAQWKLAFKANSFRQGSFEARNIDGDLTMNHFKVEASRLQFESQQGKVTGKVGVFRFASNQFGLRTDFTTEGVNIRELFTTFKNFDQDFVTAEVLSGSVDAKIEFQSFCDSLLNVDMNSIVSSVSFVVNDGALIGFKPLIDVAEEIRQKPMLRLFIDVNELKKRLENVQFATLTNELTISNGVVTIPSMEIISSALNLNVGGTHSFDDKIDYAMDFALSEVMQLKQRTEPYNEFVRRDNQGKTRIFLTMKGTTDDFEITIEKSTLGKTIKEGLLEEKNNMVNALKSEFNALMNDSLRPQTEIIDLEFDFDPDAGTINEADKASSEKPVQYAEPPGAKKLNLKKSEADKKKLKDGDFEDDDF